MAEFSKLLKEARKKTYLTQQELADQVGIDDSYISKIERGGVPPTRDKVLAIIEALGITDPAERTHLLLAAGYGSLEDIATLDGKQQEKRSSRSSAFGAPFSLGQQFKELDVTSIGEEVEKILAEAHLSDKQKKLARRLTLEQVRIICKVIKEESEERSS